MNRSIKDIYWLAGLIEGEGSFCIRDNGTFARMAIGMTDYDIIFKARNLINGRNTIHVQSGRRYKDLYQIVFSGGEAIQWMMTLYPLLGKRRRAKIREILTLWKAYKVEPRRRKLGDRCEAGHLLTKFNSYNRDRTHITCRLCHVLKMKNKNGSKHSEIEIRLIEHLKRRENTLLQSNREN